MNHQSMVQKLYTARTSVYIFFIHVVGYARAIKLFFAQSSYLKSGMKILDAGCGTGLITKILYQNARKKNIDPVLFYGFDLTPAMLKRFQAWITKKKITNVKIVQADVLKPQQLPKNWSEFDLIVISGMLEHIQRTHIVQSINNIYNLLKKDGRFLTFICRTNSISHLIITKWWKAQTYTQQEIKHIMHDAGFNSVIFHRFSFPFRYLNWWVFIIEAQKL